MADPCRVVRDCGGSQKSYLIPEGPTLLPHGTEVTWGCTRGSGRPRRPCPSPQDSVESQNGFCTHRISGSEPGDFRDTRSQSRPEGAPLSPAPPLSFLRTLFTCGCRCYCCSAVAVESVPALWCAREGAISAQLSYPRPGGTLRQEGILGDSIRKGRLKPKHLKCVGQGLGVEGWGGAVG